MSNGNPFAFPDATSYFISANKSLADINNTEAQARLHNQQALAVEEKLKSDKLTSEALDRKSVV